ncbi:MAG: hypothetical protein JW814_01595 [Candidatus Krumholzibacteriota bacterium]|nr:hypothetical protein [Candidatus Krumholzibacteriota bacterium]
MFWEILRFEILYRLRRPLLYVFAIIFFFMPFGAISTDSVMIGGAIGNVARNAPYVIVEMLIMMSLFGLLFVTIFVAPSVNRDNEVNVQQLFFSKPLTKSAYIFGRYAGSVIPVILAMVMACLGIWLASVMPYQDPERILAFDARPYIFAMAVFVIPNMLLSGAIFFSISTLTRKNFSAYVGVIAFLALWGMGAAVMADLDHQTAASIVDPFGLASFRVITRYWTIAERNTMILPVGGLLLVNRILWLAVAAAIIFLTNWRFRMMLPAGSSSKKRQLIGPAETGPVAGEPGAADFAASIDTAPDFSFRSRLAQLVELISLETRSILHSIPFLIITIFGMANLISALFINPEGTTNYPLTQHMLEAIEGAFAVMPWLVIIIYGAEIVWKNRRVRIDGIVDSLPVSNWIHLTSKLAALSVTLFIMATAAMACAVAYQLFSGYFDFQTLLYFKGLFLIMLGEWLLLCVLSVFFQVLSGNRYFGTLLMVIAFIALEVLPEMGFEHNLYLFAQIPRSPWSDMNGYGHFGKAIFWFRTYWTLFAGILVLLATLLWIRGNDRSPRVRALLFRNRLTRNPATTLAVLIAVFLLAGLWVYYNTNVVNEFTNEDQSRIIQAEYEKLYGKYEDLPQPKVVAADLEVDIYPRSRKADIAGLLTLVNSSGSEIDSLHINISPEIDNAGLEIEGTGSARLNAALLLDDRERGYRIYSLDPPLPDGDTLLVKLSIKVEEKGFMNGRTNVKLVENGTFFSNEHYMPSFGYNPGREISDPARRKEAGLPEGKGAPSVDDQEALMRSFVRDADRIRFQATVSTSLDQTAIAPGELVREWTDHGRRYFHYRAERPILNFYCFVSGRYEIAREICGETEVEVYYHPRHGMNVPRIIEAVNKSLAHYTSEYSPYPYKELRIVEFPRYRRFAQSFSTTIPFSEAANFTEDLTNESTVDMVFFITAHEIAHQWFAHQVTPAPVQGAEMIGESLTQYSALMVMEKDYGPDRMKSFLRYELDRYLSGRSNELKEEKPLMLVEDQPYIYYNKGALAMYAMRDYLGAEVMNKVMRDYVNRTAFAGPPYTNTLEFMALLRPAVPEEYAYLIEDMFETITLYDNRMEKAFFSETDDGRYSVTVEYLSRKMRADGKGYETEIDHSDWIEIGVYGEETETSGSLGRPLYQKKHRIENGCGHLELIVDEKPVRAGIDPRNILIDRVPGDNVRKVSKI